MSAYPWASETREARADRKHRFANDLWAYHNPAKRVPHKHELLYVTEAQKEAIKHADAAFWAAEKSIEEVVEKTEKSILHWLGFKA